MERVFTRPMGAYNTGAIHDWPWPTWQHIADHAGIKVADFSRPVAEVIDDSMRKGASWLKSRK